MSNFEEPFFLDRYLIWLILLRISVLEKLTTVVTQNETIAKGMIAISDKLEDWMHKAPKNAPTHSQSMPTMPNQHGPARVAPPIHDMASGAHMPPMIGNEHAGSQHGMPPPPPSKPKRKGLFK